jgi:hypothetical protein
MPSDVGATKSDFIVTPCNDIFLWENVKNFFMFKMKFPNVSIYGEPRIMSTFSLYIVVTLNWFYNHQFLVASP